MIIFAIQACIFEDNQEDELNQIESKSHPADDDLMQEKDTILKVVPSKNIDTIIEKTPVQIETTKPRSKRRQSPSVLNKKKNFFRLLKPLAKLENENILKLRAKIIECKTKIQSGEVLQGEDIVLLKENAIKYRCSNVEFDSEEDFDELLIKVNIIPKDLVLAQAAIETAWGTSYFAKEHNNYFGLWCFTPGCGVVPRSRESSKTHEVMNFENPQLSIRQYMLVLNSHPLFKELRYSRNQDINNNKKPSAYKMANGLKDYSARGKQYIKEIQSIIRVNSKLMNE